MLSVSDRPARRPGLGTMTLTGGYGYVREDVALSALRHAFDLGVALVDTADAYPGGEELVARSLAGRHDRPTVVTKCGLTGLPGRRVPCGQPSYLVRACEASLARLQVDTVDVLLLHRVDPAVPVEDSIGALADLRVKGLAAHIGLSTDNAQEVQRAAAITKLAVIEAPLSVLDPTAASSILPIVRAAGATLLARSPLGRGAAVGAPRPQGYDKDDARAHVSQMRDIGPADRAAALRALARRHSLSSVDLALGWLVSLGEDVVPIPGFRTRHQVRQDLAAQCALPPDVFDAVNGIVDRHREDEHF